MVDSGIYVIVIENEVISVIQTDTAMVNLIRAKLNDAPGISARVVGPLVISTHPTQIMVEVTDGVESWQ